MKSLQGIFPALLTPFDKNGKIIETSLRAIVERNLKAGVNGFYVCGSTGEAFLLSMEERKRVVEIVIDAVNGKAAVICHIGAIGTDHAIELGKHAVQAGVDAVSSIPPFYYKFSSDEIMNYYIDIWEALKTKIIPYNFPSFSGVTLTPDMIKEMGKKADIAGIKFTSNDLFQLERMKKEAPDLLVYNGFDEIFLAGLVMGAEGAIGSTFNVMADKFIGIWRAFSGGNITEAKSIQAIANEVIEALIQTHSMFNAEKYLLELEGIEMGEARKPFAPLTDEAKDSLKKVYNKYLR